MADLVRTRGGPVVAVPAYVNVADAVKLMDRRDVGAVVVEEAGAMVGIFSERDLLRRVVGAGRDPSRTRVSDVMSSPVVAASVDADRGEIVETMVVRHIRHVPVVDRAGRPVGMLSLRSAMTDRVDELQHEVDVLEAYLGYDGVSG